MISWIASLAGLALIGLGALGAVSPVNLRTLRHGLTLFQVYEFVGALVVVGIVLIAVSARSRTPKLLRPMGLAALLLGLLTMVVDVDTIRSILENADDFGPIAVQIAAGLVAFCGLIILFAVVGYRDPRRR